MRSSEQIERCEINGERYYKVTRADQEPLVLPSVTTVLGVIDKGLAPWAARVAVEHLAKNLPVGQVLTPAVLRKEAAIARTRYLGIAEEAALAGTQAHEAVEHFLCTGKVPQLPNALPGVASCVERFAEWWASQKLTVLATELPIYWVDADGKGFAGTLDILAESEDGTTVVLDLKSSKTTASLDSWRMQAACYAVGVSYRLSVPRPNRIVIVNVPRSGTGVKTFTLSEQEIDTHFRLFLHVLQLHYSLRSRDGREPSRIAAR